MFAITETETLSVAGMGQSLRHTRAILQAEGSRAAQHIEAATPSIGLTPCFTAWSCAVTEERDALSVWRILELLILQLSLSPLLHS